MYFNRTGIMQATTNKINDLTMEEWISRCSSINSTKEEIQNLIQILPLIHQLRSHLIRAYGPNVAEQLFGNIVPPVAAYPAKKPNAFDLNHPASYDKREIQAYIDLMTKRNDNVLDIMAGSGVTLEVCYETGRRGWGIELMEQWCKLTEDRLSAVMGSKYTFGLGNQFIKQGDCREILPAIKSDSLDFEIFSPPYYNILNNPKGWRSQNRKSQGLATMYGNSEKELGRVGSYSDFMNEMGLLYSQCYRVLKPDKYMVVIVADIFADGMFIPYSADTINVVQATTGFKICGIQIVLDHWKKCFGYGIPYKVNFDFHHHYALVFKKEQKAMVH